MLAAAPCSTVRLLLAAACVAAAGCRLLLVEGSGGCSCHGCVEGVAGDMAGDRAVRRRVMSALSACGGSVERGSSRKPTEEEDSNIYGGD